MDDFCVEIGKYFHYELPGTLFSDPNGHHLSISHTMNSGVFPAWLTYSDESYSYHGYAIAPSAVAGVVSVRITADDSHGATVFQDFTITQTNRPTEIAETTVTTVAPGDPISISVGSNFNDPDGDTLTYALSLSNGLAKPNFLSVDASGIITNIISTTVANLGVYNLKVTASDACFSASTILTLVINNPPVLVTQIED